MGFDPGFERPACLATLKSSDRTKQSVCGWQYIYIYIFSVKIWINSLLPLLNSNEEVIQIPKVSKTEISLLDGFVSYSGHFLILLRLVWFGMLLWDINNWRLFHAWAIGLMSSVFANGPGDVGSIPRWVIPKSQKMVLDAALFNTQHCKVRIKGNVEQSWEWSSAFSYTSV